MEMFYKLACVLFVFSFCCILCGMITSAENENVTTVDPVPIVIPPINESKPALEAPLQEELLTPIDEMNQTYELIPIEEPTYTEELPVEEIPVYEEPVVEETMVKVPAQEVPVQTYSVETTAPVKKEVQPVTAPVTKETTKPNIQSIVCKQIATGSLSYPAPQIYYEVVAGDNGEIKMGSQFQGKKFVLVPIN